MGDYQTIRVADGEFKAYVARPSAAKALAVVVIQEIFGVNEVMRDITDGLAGQGYLAICPDLFWRIEPGIDITDHSKEEWARAFELFNAFKVDTGVQDIAATVDQIRQDPACSGKVGAVGFCLGGLLAFLTACRTSADATVSYYGVGLDNVIAEEDGFVNKAAQAAIIAAVEGQSNVTVHTYPGRDHAFARVGGEHYNGADAMKAGQRSLDFFKQHLG